MNRFLREQSGSALIWSLFIILIMFTISFTVYSGITVYAKYKSTETELQRAATISADASMENENVRDIQLDIPVSVETQLEKNLADVGWTKEGSSWQKYDGNKKICCLEDMKTEVIDMTMQIDAVFAMPLPWAINNIGWVRIPMHIRTSILYVD